MSDIPVTRLPRLSWQQGLARNRRLLVAFTAFIGIFVCLDVISPGPISYFEINFLSSNNRTPRLRRHGPDGGVP